MIKREITVPVELAPEELAFEFCRMNDGDHAQFFNELAKLTEKWEKPFCFQLQYIVDHPLLTAEGRRIMQAIGEYGEPV